jgi:hypothetical protein
MRVLLLCVGGAAGRRGVVEETLEPGTSACVARK